MSDVKRYTYDGHRAGFVAAHDYDALAARLAQAEDALRGQLEAESELQWSLAAERDALRGLLREAEPFVHYAIGTRDLIRRIKAALGTADRETAP